jgi:hypothetical protein
MRPSRNDDLTIAKLVVRVRPTDSQWILDCRLPIADFQKTGGLCG